MLKEKKQDAFYHYALKSKSGIVRPVADSSTVSAGATGLF